MKNVEVRISNDSESIAVCISALKEFCHQIGFKRREASKISHIIEALLHQIFKCSFLEGQEGEVHMLFQNMDEGLELKITDFGIPMDVEQIEKCKKDDKENFAHMYYILKNYMDEVDISAKGYQGNQLIFKKKIRSKHHHHLHEEIGSNLEFDLESKNIDIQLLNQDKAADISKLAYMAYHYSYPNEDLYIPHKIKERINQGVLISSGAVDLGENLLISHSALELSSPQSKTAELGVAFTDPEYRGSGLIHKIWVHLIEEIAIEKELFGVFAMAVCSHPYSQKACHKMNMKDCALLVSRAPVLDFEGIDVAKAQRESLLINFRVLKQVEDVVFYIPKHHKKIILEIFKNLEIKVSVGKHPFYHLDSLHHFTQLKIHTDTVFNVANIQIQHIGKDLKQEFVKELVKLKNNRFESIYLYLDLADYHTEKYTSYFEDLGFFFAGVMHFENRMNLVLQLLNNQSYDFKALKIDAEFGKKLTQYVENEYHKRSLI